MTAHDWIALVGLSSAMVSAVFGACWHLSAKLTRMETRIGMLWDNNSSDHKLIWNELRTHRKQLSDHHEELIRLRAKLENSD